MQQIDSIDQRGCEIAGRFDFLFFLDNSGGRCPEIPVMRFLIWFLVFLNFRTGFLFRFVLVILLLFRLRVCRFVLNLSKFICR